MAQANYSAAKGGIDGRWTPGELETRLLAEVGQEEMPILAMLKEREGAVKAGAQPNA